MVPKPPLRVGSEIHGFANGYFGRDSYACRRIEAEGVDWFVTRNTEGVVELISRRDAESIDDPDDRDYCGDNHWWRRTQGDTDAEEA